MNVSTLTDLLEETISLAIEDGAAEECDDFVRYAQDMLPPEVLSSLEDINGDVDFLRIIWEERLMKDTIPTTPGESAVQSDEEFQDGCCLVCERSTKLTRHHLFPRETHKRLSKEGFTGLELNTTMNVCRMCHSAIHRFFTNDDLANSFYSLDLLLNDEKFFKYAKWASKQKTQKMR